MTPETQLPWLTCLIVVVCTLIVVTVVRWLWCLAMSARQARRDRIARLERHRPPADRRAR